MDCGRDPTLAKESVGAVLQAQVVRAAIEDRVPTYRLLQGDAGYKLRWATEVPSTETRVVGSGLLGALGGAAITLLNSLPEGARDRLLRGAR
jgi:hypothetical protein